MVKVLSNRQVADGVGNVRVMLAEGTETVSPEGYANLYSARFSGTAVHAQDLQKVVVTTRRTVRNFLGLGVRCSSNLAEDIASIIAATSFESKKEKFVALREACALVLVPEDEARWLSNASVTDTGKKTLLENLLWTCIGLLQSTQFLKVTMHLGSDGANAQGYVKNTWAEQSYNYGQQKNEYRAFYLYHYAKYVAELETSAHGHEGDDIDVDHTLPNVIVSKKPFVFKRMHKRHIHLKYRPSFSFGFAADALAIRRLCWTFIHEASHKYALTDDVAYLPSDRFRSQALADFGQRGIGTSDYDTDATNYNREIRKADGLANNADTVATFIMKHYVSPGI